MSNKVVHCRKEIYDEYIGRPSRWSNPFVIGPDGTREDVIEKFEIYYLQDEWMQAHIGELKNKVLGCWCDPLPCHGDILAKYAERTV